MEKRDLLDSRYLAIIWNWRCTPIPAIFVSYPYTKFKRFGKEHTTICSGPLFLKGIVYYFS